MKQLKKIIILVTFILSISIPSFGESPNISSGAAIVMEESTGKVIFNKNAYEIMYPASTTKIMTAILAIEKCDLSDMVEASSYAVDSIPNGYTTADIQVGEILSVENLLYALMLRSANEAATILAEHIAGSEQNFAKMMNDKALEIGCKNTNFVNGNGIHNDNHVSTAYDLALIAKYAMQNDTFKQIVSTTSYTLPATNKYNTNDRILYNTNGLIMPNNNENSNYSYYYPYATGIKTGFTTPAKNCLVASSSKNGINLISVVLYSDVTDDGISQRYVDTINLFNYVFDNYAFSKVLEKYSIVKSIGIGSNLENLNLLLENDIISFVNTKEESLIENEQIQLKENLNIPIYAGEIVGKVTYTIDGIDYTQNLIADKDIGTEFNPHLFFILIGLLLLIISVKLFLFRPEEKF